MFNPGFVSAANVSLKSYRPSMPVISTMGLAVKRDINQTRLARLADGAVMVMSPLGANANIIIGLGLPSGPRALAYG